MRDLLPELERWQAEGKPIAIATVITVVGSAPRTVGATLAVSLVMMFALKFVGILRVSKEGELEGLDLHEHGTSAYPEYALAGGVTPALNGHDADAPSTPVAELAEG